MALGLAAATREKSTTGRLAGPVHGMYFVKQSTRGGALQRCVQLQLGSSLQRPHAGWAYYQCSATETHSCAALAPGALPLREVRAGTTSCWRVSDPPNSSGDRCFATVDGSQAGTAKIGDVESSELHRPPLPFARCAHLAVQPAEATRDPKNVH
jgi:hypothetical protein